MVGDSDPPPPARTQETKRHSNSTTSSGVRTLFWGWVDRLGFGSRQESGVRTLRLSPCSVSTSPVLSPNYTSVDKGPSTVRPPRDPTGATPATVGGQTVSLLGTDWSVHHFPVHRRRPRSSTAKNPCQPSSSLRKRVSTGPHDTVRRGTTHHPPPHPHKSEPPGRSHGEFDRKGTTPW